MSEVVATFRTTDGWHERADPAAQATNSPLGDLSQEGFELAGVRFVNPFDAANDRLIDEILPPR